MHQKECVGPLLWTKALRQAENDTNFTHRWNILSSGKALWDERPYRKIFLQRLYDCASSKKEKDIFDLTKKKGIQNNSMVERHISWQVFPSFILLIMSIYFFREEGSPVGEWVGTSRQGLPVKRSNRISLNYWIMKHLKCWIMEHQIYLQLQQNQKLKRLSKNQAHSIPLRALPPYTGCLQAMQVQLLCPSMNQRQPCYRLSYQI